LAVAFGAYNFANKWGKTFMAKPLPRVTYSDVEANFDLSTHGSTAPCRLSAPR
jgi:hypothetical protein